LLIIIYEPSNDVRARLDELGFAWDLLVDGKRKSKKSKNLLSPDDFDEPYFPESIDDSNVSNLSKPEQENSDSVVYQNESSENQV